MNKPYVVFLNGPPGSGKDYAAEILTNADDLVVEHMKFAHDIKTVASTLLKVPREWIEKNKNTVVQPYNVTVRQLLIDISEKWMKPCYGKDIFGKLASSYCAEDIRYVDNNEDEEHPDIVVFSDCGFSEEVKHVLQLFGNENALLIRLHRGGCTFEGDSRSYIELPDVRTIDISNMGDITFGMMLLSSIRQWLQEKKND